MQKGRGRWFVLVLLIASLAAPVLAQTPVKMGVLTPLSPPGDASAGQFIVRGAKMALEDVNARGGVLGGRKLELVIEDDAGTPEKGAAGFRKLATQDQVVAVIGQFHSSVMTAVQALAEQFEIPVFSTQASARSLTERHLNYTFRTHVIDPDRVRLWNHWIKERGFKRVALITENTDYGVGIVEETKQQFKTMEVQAELKTIIFDRAVVDLTPQLLEIKNWKPDVLLNGGVGTPVYLIIKQAYDIGLFPAGAHAGVVRPASAGRVLEESGRQRELSHLHRLLPSDHEAHRARRGLPHEVHGAVQGGADLRRLQRLYAGDTPGRCPEGRQERQGGRPGQGPPGEQIRGLEWHHQLHARRRSLLAAVESTDAVHPIHQAGAAVSRGENRLPAGIQDR